MDGVSGSLEDRLKSVLHFSLCNRAAIAAVLRPRLASKNRKYPLAAPDPRWPSRQQRRDFSLQLNQLGTDRAHEDSRQPARPNIHGTRSTDRILAAGDIHNFYISDQFPVWCVGLAWNEESRLTYQQQRLRPPVTLKLQTLLPQKQARVQPAND